MLGFIELMSYFIAFQERSSTVSALIALPICVVLGGALLWLTSKYVYFERAVRFAADRMIIFLFVYLPVAGIAFILVLMRILG